MRIRPRQMLIDKIARKLKDSPLQQQEFIYYCSKRKYTIKQLEEILKQFK